MRFCRCVTLIFACLIRLYVAGQGWENVFELEGNDFGLEIYNNATGGFSVFSTSLQTFEDESLLQLDDDGNLLARIKFHRPLGSKYFKIVATDKLSNGNFIVCGNLQHEILDPNTVFLMMIGASGQLIWTKEYPERSYSALDVSIVSDSGFILTGYSTKAGRPDSLFLLKTDSIGEIQWEQTYGDIKDTRGNQVIECRNGGFSVIGRNKNGPGNQFDFWLVRTDSLGNLIWTRKYGDGTPDIGYAIVETKNGGFIIAGSGAFPGSSDGYSDATVIKTDSLGFPLWIKSYEGPDHGYAYAIIPTSDNGYILCGQLNDSLTAGYTGYLCKISSNGQLIWSKSFREGAYVVLNSIVEAPDKGFAISGYIKKYTNSYAAVYVLRTDSLGNILSSYLEGEIFWDENQNCSFDSNELKLDHFIIQAIGKRDVPGVSDQSGRFFMRLDTGNYQISVHSPNKYWEACVSPVNISALTNDTTQVQFAMQEVVSCPYLEMSVSTSFLRRCFPGVYTINYCNKGTAPASGVEINVKLDTFIQLTSASSTYSLTNGVYTFGLNDLQPNECGAIKLYFLLSCDASLGMIHCIDVNILPDTICIDGVQSQSHTTECQINRGAFDPNDKRSFVDGSERTDTISPDYAIEYQIRFQNTGTDTAFNVIILDTIQNELDLLTIQPGASSHPYEFDILAPNVLRFYFKNILLPDSAVNEAASNGFIKFRINQKPHLPIGTMIKNSANIYFDFNSPEVTNRTTLTVEQLISSSSVPTLTPRLLHVYPNPVHESLHLDIPFNDKRVLFRLFDVTGKKVIETQGFGKKMIIDMENLIPGVYFYHVYFETGVIGTGTIMYQ